MFKISKAGLRARTGIRAGEGPDGGGAPPRTTPPTVAPVAPASPAPSTPAPPAPAAPAPAGSAPSGSPANPPAYLAPRLAEERRKAINDVVAKLGIKVGKKDDVDAKLQEALDKFTSNKEKRRALRDRVRELETSVQDAAGLRATLKVLAESEVSLLPETMRGTLKQVAGEDHLKQLETISGWKLAGILQAAPVAPSAPPAAVAPPAPVAPAAPVAPPVVAPPVAPAPPAPPAPLPAPVTSAPPAPGPVPTSPLEPADLVAEVTRLGASLDPRDKMRARLLVLQNPQAYAEASAKASAR